VAPRLPARDAGRDTVPGRVRTSAR